MSPENQSTDEVAAGWPEAGSIEEYEYMAAIYLDLIKAARTDEAARVRLDQIRALIRCAGRPCLHVVE